MKQEHCLRNHHHWISLKRFLVLPVVVSAILLCGQAAQSAVTHIYFSVNGDTTATEMIQTDTLRWAAYCDTGAVVHWDIWYDANANSLVDSASDLMLYAYNVVDGDIFDFVDQGSVIFIDSTSIFVPRKDNDSDPDGWYQSRTVSDGLPPGSYLFCAIDRNDMVSQQQLLTVHVIPSPTSRVRGRIAVPGHPAPDEAALANHMVEAIFVGPENDQSMLSFTDANGEFEVGKPTADVPILVILKHPQVAGYRPADQEEVWVVIEDTGVVVSPDLNFEIPTDSVYGNIVDDYGQIITAQQRISPDLYDVFTSQAGRFAYYPEGAFGPDAIALGAFMFGENLFPEYMSPGQTTYYGKEHSFRADVVCPLADTTVFVRVTENGAPPERQYIVKIASDSLYAWTATVTGTGSNNVATLHISSRPVADLTLNIGNEYSAYPVPDTVYAEYSKTNFGPGDTIDIDWRNKFRVQGTFSFDPLDQPGGAYSGYLNMVLKNPAGSYWKTVPLALEGFTLYSPPGLSTIAIYSSDLYLASPHELPVMVSGDTTGGLDLVLNRRTWEVTGRLVNIPTSIGNSLKAVIANTDSIGAWYHALDWVDRQTGVYSLLLCDGQWTIEAPAIEGYATPPPQTLTIGNDPGTTTIDFVYSVATDVGEPNEETPLPSAYQLHQNYPNPFNPTTTIRFDLPGKSDVEMVVYNVLGQRITCLVNETLGAGSHQVNWDGRDASGSRVASGVYLYRLTAGEFVQTRKMLLLK